MIQTAASPIAISADVLAFAAAQGVSAEVSAVTAMTQQVFAKATVNLILDSDPEIPDDWHIVIAARDVQIDVDEALAATWEWDRQLFALVPAPKVCVFRLSVAGVQ